VSCKRDFDLDGLQRDRDVLMAEALHLYRAGRRWHFHKDEDADLIVTAKKEQSARVAENVNATSFLSAAHACAGLSTTFPGTASVEEIMNNLKVSLGRERAGLAPQCGKALTQAGWRRERPRDDSGVQRVRYRRPD
jgi:predicted P-loop ATPase